MGFRAGAHGGCRWQAMGAGRAAACLPWATIASLACEGGRASCGVGWARHRRRHRHRHRHGCRQLRTGPDLQSGVVVSVGTQPSFSPGLAGTRPLLGCLLGHATTTSPRVEPCGAAPQKALLRARGWLEPGQRCLEAHAARAQASTHAALHVCLQHAGGGRRSSLRHSGDCATDHALLQQTVHYCGADMDTAPAYPLPPTGPLAGDKGHWRRQRAAGAAPTHAHPTRLLMLVCLRTLRSPADNLPCPHACNGAAGGPHRGPAGGCSLVLPPALLPRNLPLTRACIHAHTPYLRPHARPAPLPSPASSPPGCPLRAVAGMARPALAGGGGRAVQRGAERHHQRRVRRRQGELLDSCAALRCAGAAGLGWAGCKGAVHCCLLHVVVVVHYSQPSRTRTFVCVWLPCQQRRAPLSVVWHSGMWVRACAMPCAAAAACRRPSRAPTPGTLLAPAGPAPTPRPTLPRPSWRLGAQAEDTLPPLLAMHAAKYDQVRPPACLTEGGGRRVVVVSVGPAAQQCLQR